MFERNYNIISRKYKEFFLPTVLLSMSMYLSFLINGIIVGNLIGPNGLAAIALMIPVTGLFSTIYWTFGIGGSVLASIAKAERNEEKSKLYFTISIISLLICGLIIAIIGYFYINSIAAIFTTSKILYPLFIDYGKILFIGVPFLFIALGTSYFMRAEGKPHLATSVLISSNVTTVIMNIIYIKSFNMGIEGAALATVTGYIVSMIFVVKYLISSERSMKFTSLIKIKLRSLKDVIFSGFPPASGQLFILLKTFFINILILATIGEAGTVAFGICFNLLIVALIPIIGVCQTMSPIASVFFSEKDYNGVKLIMKRSLIIVVVSCIALTLVLILFPNSILNIFGVTGANNITVGEEAIRLFSLSFVGTAITFLMLFYTQAIQRKTLSFIISISQGLLILVPSAYLLSKLIGGVGIWISFTIAEIGTILIIYLATKIIRKKTHGKYSGVLILPKNENISVLDVTVENSVEDAIGLSEKIINFAEDNGVDKKISMYMGIAVEEIVINTINHNSQDVDYIDILSTIGEKEIKISFKDSGIEYDPTKYISNEKNQFENIEVLKKIASKIDYARLIGLNSTIITIKR